MFRTVRLTLAIKRQALASTRSLTFVPRRPANFGTTLGRRFLTTEAPKKASTGPRAPISWRSVAFLTIFGSSVLFYFKTEYDEKMKKKTAPKVQYYGKASIGGPYVMVDHDGVPVTDATFRGKFTLLYFGFSHCPDICPSELVKVGKVMTELEKKGIGDMVVPVYISLDPARDTIGQLRHYAKDFHPSVRFLTGTTEQLEKVARSYRVYFMKADEHEDDEEEYLVDHSIVFYLCGPDGEFIDFCTQGSQVLDMVSKCENLVREYKAKVALEARGSK